MSWEVTQVLEGKNRGKDISSHMTKVENDFINDGGKFETVRVGDLFKIRPTKNYGLTNQKLFAKKGFRQW